MTKPGRKKAIRNWRRALGPEGRAYEDRLEKGVQKRARLQKGRYRLVQKLKDLDENQESQQN